MKTTKIIEFVGQAGCGKTYFANNLFQKIGKTSINTNKIKLGWKIIFSYIISNPVAFYYIVCFVIQTRPKTLSDHIGILKAIINYHAKINYAKRLFNVVIVDESIFHKLRYIRRRSKIDDLGYVDIKKKIRQKIFGNMDIVVFLSCNQKIASERIKNRDGHINFKPNKVKYNNEFQKTKLDLTLAKNEINFVLLEICTNEGNLSEPVKKIIKNLSCLQN